jgi:hypothetical protein
VTGLRFCLFISSYELQISLKIVELLKQRRQAPPPDGGTP